MWPDNKITSLFNIKHPILLAPMAGPGGAELASGVAQGGGLASLPCAMLSAERIRKDVSIIRGNRATPINLNFFCHTPEPADPNRDAQWKSRLAEYYVEFGLDPDKPVAAINRAPFDAEMCSLVEELRPEVVSFHFGLPAENLLQRVRDAGCKIIASATTADEAKYLADRGCDAIIAQGAEAGGHRGMFLTDNVASQAGTMALVPQVVDAVSVPVIAAGGISDARGIAAAFALGASAVQIGTAYLLCPEANVPAMHLDALRSARDDATALTNVFSGRPARGIINRVMREVGPISDDTPAFPTAGGALAPLKAAAEAQGSADFTSLWSGQAVGLAREMPARELTETFASEAQGLLKKLGSV